MYHVQFKCRSNSRLQSVDFIEYKNAAEFAKSTKEYLETVFDHPLVWIVFEKED